MRRQDELLALYPRADTLTRRYILGELVSVPIRFDCEDLAERIDGSAEDADAAVAAQALSARERAAPDLIAYTFGLDAGRAGMWTTAMQRDALPQADSPPAGPGSDALALREALGRALKPARKPLLEVASRPGPYGDRARHVLGLIPVEGAREVLLAGAADPARAPSALPALARHDADAAASAIGARSRVPTWIRALAGATVGGRVAAVSTLAAVAGDEAEQWGAAQGLATLEGDDWPVHAARLLETGSGWVRVIALDAIGRRLRAQAAAAPPVVTRWIERSVDGAPHVMIAIAAVRALAGSRGDEAAALAVRCLERDQPLVRTAAIETLAELGAVGPELIDPLRVCARSGPLKLKGAAVLGLASIDADLAQSLALELARSPDAAARVEGAWCLGYVQDAASLEALSLLASRDPFLPSVLQCLESLAHYPEREAAPLLVALLDDARPEAALAAVRVLTHFPGEVPLDLGAPLARLAGRLEPPHRRKLLREVGRLAPSVRGARDLLASPWADEESRLGAAEGLARAGAPQAGGRDGATGMPGAVAGAQARVLAGDLGALEPLARCLADETGCVLALRALAEIAVVAGHAGRWGRFDGLAAALKPAAPATGRARRSGAAHLTAPPSAEAPPVRFERKTGSRPDLSGLIRTLDTAVRRPQTVPPAWVLDLTTIQSHGLALLNRARELASTPLVAAVAAAALALLGVQSCPRDARSPEARAVRSLDRTLSVRGLVGKPVLILSGRQVEARAGAVSERGDRVRTAAGQKVELASRWGHSVLVFPESEVEVAAAPDRAGDELVLELRSGALVADTLATAPPGRVRIRCAAGELAAEGATMRAHVSDGALRVHVGAGRATLSAPAGRGEVMLDERETALLVPGEPPGPAEPFAAVDVEWR